MTHNDGAFINDTPVQYCVKRAIEFTRSRAYRKNDQAWIEQKNGSVVRQFAGHDRYSGQIAGQTMVHLYKSVSLYVNYFQPSFKLDFVRSRSVDEGVSEAGVQFGRDFFNVILQR